MIGSFQPLAPGEKRATNAEGDASQNTVEDDVAGKRVWRTSLGEELSCPRVSVGHGSVRICGGSEERLLLPAAVAHGFKENEEALERA